LAARKKVGKRGLTITFLGKHKFIISNFKNEATQLLSWEYINSNFFAVYKIATPPKTKT
jgi:hypothetical protein